MLTKSLEFTEVKNVFRDVFCPALSRPLKRGVNAWLVHEFGDPALARSSGLFITRGHLVFLTCGLSWNAKL